MKDEWQGEGVKGKPIIFCTVMCALLAHHLSELLDTSSLPREVYLAPQDDNRLQINCNYVDIVYLREQEEEVKRGVEGAGAPSILLVPQFI